VIATKYSGDSSPLEQSRTGYILLWTITLALIFLCAGYLSVEIERSNLNCCSSSLTCEAADRPLINDDKETLCYCVCNFCHFEELSKSLLGLSCLVSNFRSYKWCLSWSKGYERWFLLWCILFFKFITALFFPCEKELTTLVASASL
jgi:hypothetical protein